MKSVYIAAPFFNPKQIEIVENIKGVLNALDITYFSPKDENLFKHGQGSPISVVHYNCVAIDSSSIMIAVTDDKDVGTMWEAGYAYSVGIPTIFVWVGHEPGMKFNIMLAATCVGAVSSYNNLYLLLKKFINTGIWDKELFIKQSEVIHE